ncbi:protein fantom [Solea solea]|uniref:protein fantom n=1 Tax=Solea solea TaxID=90069 RepID=UPI00272D79D5|nr:protein fantom [Solea solea]
MFTRADETAIDDMSQLKAVLQDLTIHQNARGRPDITRLSRKELEDWFWRLYDESLLYKQHSNKQDDMIKKLSTKVMRLKKDQGRMEQLAAGGARAVSKVRNKDMEEMLEELQEKVQQLQTENERLKQRLLVAKHQLLNSQTSRSRPNKQVHSQINSGLKKRTDSPSLAHTPLSQLKEARAKIHNLENVIESQRSHMEEMDAELEQLKEALRKEAEKNENRLLQAQMINKLKEHVSNNLTQIQLQKQLTDKSNTVTALEGQLQEHKQTLKAALQKLDELSEQLKHERLKSRELENWLQISNNKLELLPQQLNEVEQEKDQLKENYNKLLDSIFDASQQQKWQVQEQQLRLQIMQLETDLKADLDDKNKILQKLKTEQETQEKLAKENKKLQFQFLEQKQEMDKLIDCLKDYSKESEPCKERCDLSVMAQVEDRRSSKTESCIQELQSAQSKTIRELSVGSLLWTKNNYMAELKAAQQKMDSDSVHEQQQLEILTQQINTSTANTKIVQAHLRETTYSPKRHIFRQEMTDCAEGDKFGKRLHLKCEVLVELQIVCASLSPSLLEALGDSKPYTICTYSFYLFELQSTPVMKGHRPKYNYKSKYMVNMDKHFLNYLSTESVTINLHQAMGMDCRNLAKAQLRLQQLLKQDSKVHGTINLVSAELGTVGSVDYWMRLTAEPSRLIKGNQGAGGDFSFALKAPQSPHGFVAKHSCLLIPPLQ